VTEVYWRIIANLGIKFRFKFTVHCGRVEGSSQQQHLALCYPLLGPLVIFSACHQDHGAGKPIEAVRPMHQLVTPNCTWLALWRYLWQVLFWLHDNNIDHLSVVDATLPRACPEQTGGTGNFPFLTRSEKKLFPYKFSPVPVRKCVCVCVLDTTVSCAKTAEPIEIRYGLIDKHDVNGWWSSTTHTVWPQQFTFDAQSHSTDHQVAEYICVATSVCHCAKTANPSASREYSRTVTFPFITSSNPELSFSFLL